VGGIRLRRANRQKLVGMVLVFLCCLVLWTSTPASAHFLNHHDPDDAAGGLDLSMVHLWEYQQEGLFSLVVRTYDQIEGTAGSSVGSTASEILVGTTPSS
jgi:hypothetical protein